MKRDREREEWSDCNESVAQHNNSYKCLCGFVWLQKFSAA
jgi:hypothetical protein